RFAARAFGRTESAYVVGAAGSIEGSVVAPKKAHRKHGFRGNAVVVTALALAHRAGCGDSRAVYDAPGRITNTGQRGRREGIAVGQPPLGGRAKRPGSARHAEDRRCHVVVQAVDAPDPAKARARAIVRAEQEPAAEKRLHHVSGVQGELEVEVI